MATEFPLDQPLLTLAMIIKWHRERVDLEKRIEELDRMLRGAAMFVDPSILEAHDIEIDDDDRSRSDTRGAEAIEVSTINAIRAAPEGLTPKQIVGFLAETPEAAEKLRELHPNYIYNLLTKLVYRGLISRSDGKYTFVESDGGKHRKDRVRRE
jgi:hypothetical protein